MNRKRQGMILPLTIAVTVFILLIGAVVISIASSSHKVAYGNMMKMQSYYLAKAGIEMGNAFLYTPSNTSNPNSNNWFELGSTINTEAKFAAINNQLNNRTKNGKAEIKEIYIETNGDGSKETYLYTKNQSGVRKGSKLGEIQVEIQLIDTEGKGQAKDCIYRIISTGQLSRYNNVNSNYEMKLDVRVTNEFDKKIY